MKNAMRTRRIVAALLVAFASASVPTTITRTAAAQADDPVTTQARQRFKEGVEFYDKGRYEEARLAFLQAYTLKKHPAVLLNLAQSTAKAGHTLEAAKYFKQFLKESTSASAQQRKDAETGLAEARQKLGRIEVVAPAGTEITLDDGEKLGTAPLAEPIDVEPGPHTIKSPTDSTKVIATAGQKVEAKLGPTSSAATPVVPVTTPPSGSEPAGDSTASGASDAEPTDVAPPPAGDTGAKRTNLLSPPKNMTPVYVGLTVTGLGIISAIVFAAFKEDAQSKADAVANDIRRAASTRGISSQGICTSTNPTIQRDFGQACATLQDNNDKVDTNATIANISVGVAIAGGVGTLIYYFAADKADDRDTEPPKEVRRFRPVITPYGGFGSGGLSLSASF